MIRFVSIPLDGPLLVLAPRMDLFRHRVCCPLDGSIHRGVAFLEELPANPKALAERLTRNELSTVMVLDAVEDVKTLIAARRAYHHPPIHELVMPRDLVTELRYSGLPASYLYRRLWTGDVAQIVLDLFSAGRCDPTNQWCAWDEKAAFIM